ncbi:serine/threonine-protein kinase [Streptomyces sp. P9(2023)]|uniref:serine/threonine-protein kinase n=1 Tax=Streptomyces sp. P9(2023) TaxID=3064394 RepID=UPI0028F440E6|nr:serine/threonine-protein kinase [Streptomyces sp. P9(2023)]MDT9693023.1 serine/threonine-protein kinase [Streptomyces sp. P9(2023)]
MEPLNAEDPVSVGPFRLLGRLGAGGMGRVFLARSSGGRTVAVKVVHAELAAQDEFRRRFAREVASLERVGGTGTTPVLGSDTTAEAPWVAVGYVPGPSLRAVVGEEFGPLPPATVRTLAAGTARALTHVHEAGLVHRDLKPSNVLLTVDGPRLIDFGIARAVETVTDGGLTSTGALVGSPGFMSPEQVRGEKLTAASDIFCLGSVLVYAATGRSPFGTADSGVHATMFRIAHDEPDLTDLPAELSGLVRACLAKDPARRPSAAELVETITVSDPWLPADVLARLGRHAARILEAEPTTSAAGPDDPTPVPGAAPVPRPPRHRRTGLIAAATALVVAAAAGLTYTFWPEPGTGDDGRKNRAGAPGAEGASGSPRPAGIVPAAFLGAWEGVLRGSVDSPRDAARIEISQGPAGAKAAVYTRTTEEQMCMGRSRLVSADEDKVVLGESDVTTSIPAQRCTPPAHQTLTLRSPEVLEWSSGAVKTTFRKARTGAAMVPAQFVGAWKQENDPLIYGDNADRYTDEVTVTQGPVGSPVLRIQRGFPRLDEEGALTADTVNCSFTALLSAAGVPMVVGPGTADPDSSDSDCERIGTGSYVVVDRFEGRERLLLYPMLDGEPGEYYRR